MCCDVCALAGDALAHAVLPGVFLSFLLLGSSNLLVLLSGTHFTGIAGVAATSGLRRFTRICVDAAICIVLGMFSALDLCLVDLRKTLAVAAKPVLICFLRRAVSARPMHFWSAGRWPLRCWCFCFIKNSSSPSSMPGWHRCKAGRYLAGVDVDGVCCRCSSHGIAAIGAVMMAAMLLLPWQLRGFGPTDSVCRSSFPRCWCTGRQSWVAPISLQYERLPAGPIIVLVGAAILMGSLVIAPRRGLIVRELQRRWRRMFDAVRLRFESNEAFWPRDVPTHNQQTAFIEDITHRESTVFHRSPETTG